MTGSARARPSTRARGKPALTSAPGRAGSSLSRWMTSAQARLSALSCAAAGSPPRGTLPVTDTLECTGTFERGFVGS